MESREDRSLERGRRLDLFEIHSVLGAGSFGITYRALDTRLRRHVAIKEYCPRHFAVRDDDGSTVVARSDQHAAAFRGGLSMFLNEARLLARFSHPAIVRVSQLLECFNTAYIVMELERGDSLKAVLSDSKRMNTLRMMHVFAPLLDGLRSVHERSVLHCDISMSNIMLREDGTAVLVDFGASRAAWDAELTAGIGARVYTRSYAAPEVHQLGAATGPWTDIYGMGAVMFRCLTGEVPPSPEERQRFVDAALRGMDPISSALDEFSNSSPESLGETVRWMLELDPAKRPQDVTDVLKALDLSNADAVRKFALDRQTRLSHAGAALARPGTQVTPTRPPNQRRRRRDATHVPAGKETMTLLVRRLTTVFGSGPANVILSAAARRLDDEQVLDCVAALRALVPECKPLGEAASAATHSAAAMDRQEESASSEQRLAASLLKLAEAGRLLESQAPDGEFWE